MQINYNRATNYLMTAIAKATNPFDKKELTNVLSAVMAVKLFATYIKPEHIISMSTAELKEFNEFKEFQKNKTIKNVIKTPLS